MERFEMQKNIFLENESMQALLSELEQAVLKVKSSLVANEFDEDELLEWDSDSLINAAIGVKSLLERELGDGGFSTKQDIDDMTWELHIYESQASPVVNFSK
jgi:hypothetical protein